jgi:hypothetical protein
MMNDDGNNNGMEILQHEAAGVRERGASAPALSAAASLPFPHVRGH